MSIDKINPVGPVQEGDAPGNAQGMGIPKGGPSFKDTLNSFLSDVNGLQNKADESIKKMAAGADHRRSSGDGKC
jgi:flagellar hook-basal body complex protein FliE